MQANSIPVSTTTPAALPAIAANASSVRGESSQTAPGFAGVIHDILQRSQWGGESGRANSVPAKSGKPAKGGTLSVSGAIVATTGAVVQLSPTANLPIAGVTWKTTPQVHSPVDVAPAQPVLSGTAPQAASSNFQASILAGPAADGQLLDAAKKVSDALSTAIASSHSALESGKLASAPVAIASASDARLDLAAHNFAGPLQASTLPETLITMAKTNGPSSASIASGTASGNSAPKLLQNDFDADGSATRIAQNSETNISQAKALPQLSALPTGNIARASVLANPAEPHAALASPIGAKLDLKPVTDAATTTLPAAASPKASNNSLASSLSSSVLPMTSRTAESVAAAVPAANLKVGAQDGRAQHGEAATPKPAQASGNNQEAASQRGFERALDSSTAAQPESSRSNASEGFRQELAIAAISRNDATPGTVAGNSAAAGTLPMNGGPASAEVTQQSAATAASRNQPAANAPATPSPNPPLDPSSASHFVNDAQLLQNAGHSEMRVAMQTDKLGAIELRAHMTGDEVGAAITVEKRDAHTALAAELPALQQALSEKMLRVEQVVLIHGPLHATAGDSGGQQFGGQAPAHDRQAGNAQRGGAATGNSGNFQVSQNFIAESAEIFDSQGRLSVHA